MGLLLRWLAPWLILKAAKKYGTQFGGAYSQYGGSQQTNTKKEGEITVEKTAAQPEHKVDKSLGDYVEFEEEK